MRCLRTVGAVAVALLALRAAPAPAADAGRWVGQVTPYAWGSGMDGTITPSSGAPTVRFERSFSEILEDLDASLFVSGYARRDRLVLLGDFSYSTSSKDGRVPPGVPAEGSLRQRSLTLAGGWRAVQGETVNLDLLAGLRSWRVRGEVDVPLAGVARSPSSSFTDPILAVRANVALAPRWSVIAYADVGVAGASERTWQTVATVNYLGSARWAFSAGLRQLRVDYGSGGTRLDVTLSGPLLGASWRF
jgi:hypothetical protein